MTHHSPFAQRFRITNILAREVLDSRGYPTVEAEVILESGMRARAIVPSGASTGMFEALERRDADFHRFQGKGVMNVVETIRQDIAPLLKGHRVHDQRGIDHLLCHADGTPNKSKLGANATLAVSMACARAAALGHHVPLFRYLGGGHAHRLPMPLINIINGGAHANNGLSIQEFMIVPVGARTLLEALELSFAVFSTLKALLHKRGLSTAVGDEGGVAPPLFGTEDALDLVMEAIAQAGLNAGEDIALALDVAASEFYDSATEYYHYNAKNYDAQTLIDEIYAPLLNHYPILSIEDPLDQNDFKGYTTFTQRFGHRVQIVGDDLFVTNPERLKNGIAQGACNAILIKLNQIGTVTETLDVIEQAHRAGYKTVISHRSGETEDTFIADLSVAVNAGQIKTGSLCRSERTSKYNQLLRIQEQISQPVFSADIFRRS